MPTVYIFSLVSNIKKDFGEAIRTSAKRAGYKVETFSMNTPLIYPRSGDILVMWNRHLGQDRFAKNFENKGELVLSFENPYIPIEGQKYYSVGYGFHNSLKHAPKCLDDGERFSSFNKEIKPWRTSGSHILVTTQAKIFDGKGLGLDGYNQPEGWDTSILSKIRRMSERKILFRKHPRSKTKLSLNKTYSNIRISDGSRPIEEDLEDAHCVVLYTSNSATEALLEGIPVVLTGPHVFLKDACNSELSALKAPIMPNNRKKLFDRMAWSQFSLDEIKSGFMMDILTR